MMTTQTKEQALLTLHEHVFDQLIDVLYDTLDPTRQARLMELSTLLKTTREQLEQEHQQAILEGAGPFVQLKQRLGLMKERATPLTGPTPPAQRCDDTLILNEIQQYFHRSQTGYDQGGPLICRSDQSHPLPPTLETLQTGLYQLTVEHEPRLFACFNLQSTPRSVLILQLPHTSQPSPKWTIWTYSEDEHLWINHEHSELLDLNQLRKAFSTFSQQLGHNPPTTIAQKTLNSALVAFHHEHPLHHPWYWSFSIDCYQGIVYRYLDSCQFYVIDRRAPIHIIPWSQLSPRKQTQFYQTLAIRNTATETTHPVTEALKFYRLKK
jgi:hypothetical protein